MTHLHFRICHHVYHFESETKAWGCVEVVGK